MRRSKSSSTPSIILYEVKTRSSPRHSTRIWYLLPNCRSKSSYEHVDFGVVRTRRRLSLSPQSMLNLRVIRNRTVVVQMKLFDTAPKINHKTPITRSSNIRYLYLGSGMLARLLYATYVRVIQMIPPLHSSASSMPQAVPRYRTIGEHAAIRR